MERHQQTDGVDAVSQPTKGNGETHTETIDNATGRKANDRKGTVEGDILWNNQRTMLAPVGKRTYSSTLQR